MWKGKTADQMTEQDCKDCLAFIYEKAGVSYYIREDNGSGNY